MLVHPSLAASDSELPGVSTVSVWKDGKTFPLPPSFLGGGGPYFFIDFFELYIFLCSHPCLFPLLPPSTSEQADDSESENMWCVRMCVCACVHVYVSECV